MVRKLPSTVSNLEILFHPESPELGIVKTVHRGVSHILIDFRDGIHGAVGDSVCACGRVWALQTEVAECR